MELAAQFRALVGDMASVPLQSRDVDVREATLVARASDDGRVHLCALVTTGGGEAGPAAKRARSGGQDAPGPAPRVSAYAAALDDATFAAILASSWGLDSTVADVAPLLLGALGITRGPAGDGGGAGREAPAAAAAAASGAGSGAGDAAAPHAAGAGISLVRPRTSTAGARLLLTFAGDSYDLLLTPATDPAQLCETIKAQAAGARRVAREGRGEGGGQAARAPASHRDAPFNPPHPCSRGARA